jgi:hypothetical protein
LSLLIEGEGLGSRIFYIVNIGSICMGFWRSIRKPALIVAGIAAITGLYFAIPNKEDEFTVRGELVKDGIQRTAIGDFYRPFVETEDGIVTFPIMGTEEELSDLDRKFVSRQEAGGRGAIVGFNPESNVFSLDEIVLTSDKMHQFFPAGVAKEYVLSDDLIIPANIVKKVEKLDRGKKFIVDTGYGPEYDLEIFDEGDGRPYHMIEVGFREYDGKGNVVEDTTRMEKNFKLTYTFCDEEGHGPYPIWEPTAFRRDPCYGAGIIVRPAEEKK